MAFNPKLAIIEYYGPVVRLGIEGKWVEFFDASHFRTPAGKRAPKADLLAFIEAVDNERKREAN